jgi:hypothetical protein
MSALGGEADLNGELPQRPLLTQLGHEAHSKRGGCHRRDAELADIERGTGAIAPLDLIKCAMPPKAASTERVRRTGGRRTWDLIRSAVNGAGGPSLVIDDATSALGMVVGVCRHKFGGLPRSRTLRPRVLMGAHFSGGGT